MLRHLLKMQLHHSDKSHCRQKFGQHRRAGRWEWQAGHWRCSRGNKNQNELVIAVVKNGRTVYLQPAVKLPLMRFMPTLGPQRPAPFFFFAKGMPIPSTLHSNYADGFHIWPRILGTQDESMENEAERWAVMVNNLLRHMWSTYIRTFAYFSSLMHVNVCVLPIPSTFTPFKHSFLSVSHHPWCRVINTLVTPLDNGSKYALSYKVCISASLALCVFPLWVMLLI